VGVDELSVALRALSFVALLQAAGMAIFLALFRADLGSHEAQLRRLARISAAAALLLTIGHYFMEAARMSGDFAGVFDPSMQKLVWDSPARDAFILRVAGLLLLLNARSAIVGAGLVIFAFTRIGHTATHSPRWVLAALLCFHLGVVAFWFGALVRLYRATSSRLVERFSKFALWLVPGLFVAGVALAALLLPDVTALWSDYGRMLLLKVLGFVVLMALASVNKWRLSPGLARGDTHAAATFRKSVAAEYVLIVGVLAVSAWLTTFYSPD